MAGRIDPVNLGQILESASDIVKPIFRKITKIYMLMTSLLVLSIVLLLSAVFIGILYLNYLIESLVLVGNMVIMVSACTIISLQLIKSLKFTSVQKL